MDKIEGGLRVITSKVLDIVLVVHERMNGTPFSVKVIRALQVIVEECDKLRVENNKLVYQDVRRKRKLNKREG